jgi:hypothetical protein
MDKIIILICVVVLVIFGFGFIKQNESDVEFSQWATKCLQDGGVTSVDRVDYSSRHYECIKDGKIINHVR